MSVIARFIQAGKHIDISTGQYALGQAFRPPTVDVDLTFSPAAIGEDVLVKTPTNQSYSIPLIINATTGAGAEAAVRRLHAFLSRAGDTGAPMYFAYRGHADYTNEPTIGEHDAYSLYEVIEARVKLGNDFYLNQGTGNVTENTIDCIIKPYKTIRPMRLAEAKGAVFMDNIATADGRSKGMQVAGAITNKITNPIFEGITPEMSGWTFTPGLVDRVPDKDFVVFGNYAVRVKSTTSDSYLTQSIAAGNTNVHALSFYAKLPDGGVLNSSIVKARYRGVDQVPHVFQALENGWYRVLYSAAAQAASTTYGITVELGNTVYIDGVQLCEVTDTRRMQPLIYGDRLGCAWSGTAHQSTSTSTAGYFRYAVETYLNQGGFTLRFVWEADSIQDNLTEDLVLLDTYQGTSGYRLAYIDSTQVFRAIDGTNTANSAVVDWTVGDRYILHITYGSNGINLYINGALSGTNASHAAPSTVNYIFVGSANTPGSYAGGTFMGFSVFPSEMSATQVSNDYTRIVPLVNNGQRVDAMPFIWTKDGDSIVDKVNDGDEDNFCVISEIPGDAAASIRASIVANSVTTSASRTWFARLSGREFIRPGWLYAEKGGTGATSAYSSSNYQVISVGTGDTSLASVTLDPDTANEPPARRVWEALDGQGVHAFLIAADQGANLQLKFKITMGVTVIETDYVSVSANSGNLTFYKLPPLNPYGREILIDDRDELYAIFEVIGRRTTGTANVNVDFAQFYPNVSSVKRAAGLAQIVLSIEDDRAVISSVSQGHYDPSKIDGTQIELMPGKYNSIIIVPLAEHEGNHNDKVQTLSRIWAKPHYQLL